MTENLFLTLRKANKFQTFGRVLQRKDFWLLLSAYFTFLGKLTAVFQPLKMAIVSHHLHFFLNFPSVTIYTDKG